MDTKEIIDAMIDKIIDGDNVGAQEDFSTSIADKINTVMDLKKQEIAASIYGVEHSEEEASEEENTDENV
jgi:uncharacterized alkaline shock family protein YloU